MAELREVAFELERFRWQEPGRLEVSGRWSGLEGRRLGRPVLTLVTGDGRRRVTAMPGGQLVPSDGAEWRASFAYDGDPEAVTGAELEIGRRLVVDLPRPRRRRGRPAEPGEDRAALEARRAAERELQGEVEHLREELVALRKDHDKLEADHAAQSEQAADADAVNERLIGELGDVRTALEAAETERDRLTGELAARDEALTAAQEEAAAATAAAAAAHVEAERRLEAERAASTEVHERLATAREEAQRTIADEAGETERLRAELEAAREEAERAITAERAETSRLREELAARSANGGDDNGEAEDAARRMYDRIARELEEERSAARHLRRELDAVQAQTAEQRRATSSAAANGITPDDEAPLAATPAGRLAATRRSEAGRAATHHRAEAARVAAAYRVPEHQRSPTAVWGTRIAAMVLLAALIVALFIIVGSAG